MKKLPLLLLGTLVVAAVLRLWLLSEPHVLYWDGAVYLGMAKYLYSWGQAGLWEPIRPVIWPAILGLPWLLGLKSQLWGHLIQILFSLGIILLVFKISCQVADRRAGVIAASIIAFSSVFVFLNFRLITEIPATFFALLAIYLYLADHPFYAGLSVAAAFLSKFPFGIFLVVIILADLTRVKIWWKYLLGFAIPSAFFLLINQWWYGNMFYPLTEAARVIKINVGCSITHAQPWHMYLTRIPMDNILFVLSIIGLFLVLFKRDFFSRLLLFSVLLPMAYLFQLSCRDFRFAMMFLPFLAILAGLGTVRVLKEPFLRWPQLYPMLVILFVGFSAIGAMVNYNSLEPNPWPDDRVAYYSLPVSGTVVAASPWVAAYTDARVRTLYYPNFDTPTAEYYKRYFESEKPDYVFMDKCAGGVVCGPEDALCHSAKEEMFSALNDYRTVVSYTENDCVYALYAPFGQSKTI